MNQTPRPTTRPRRVVALLLTLALAWVTGASPQATAAPVEPRDPSTFGTLVGFDALPVVEASVGVRYMPRSETGQETGALLFQNRAGIDQTVTVQFTVPVDGDYYLALKPLLAPLYGIYSVAVDGAVLAELDTYAPTLRSGSFRTVGNLALDAGTHRMTFTSVGKNPASTGHFASYMQLLLLNQEEQEEYRAHLLASTDAAEAALTATAERIPAQDSAMLGRAAELRASLAELEERIAGMTDLFEDVSDEISALSWGVDRFDAYVDARAERPGSAFGLATADSMSLVYPEVLPCEACTAQPASIALAQGEHESVQAVVLPYAEALSGMTARVAGVVGPDGQAVDGELDMSVDPLGSVMVENTAVVLPAQDARPVNWEGWIPDPIRSDLTSVDVPAWGLQPYWVEVFAPAGLAPGEYTVSVEFAADGVQPEVLELAVEVWPFEIAANPELELSMTTKSTSPGAPVEHTERWYMLEQLYKPETPEEFEKLKFAYMDFLADFKIEPDLIYNTVPPSVEELLEIQERVGLEQFNVLYLPPYSMKFDAARPDTWQPQIDQILATVRTAMEQYQAAGLADEAYIYGFDESSNRALAAAILTQVKAEFPDLPVMSTFMDRTLGVNSGLADLIDIWVPGVEWFDLAAAQQAQARGDKVYWYTHQAVHSPLPNWFNGYAPSDTRLLLGALSHKMGVDGFLYYNIMRWVNREPMADGVLSSWDPQTYSTSNGDGSLFYPGVDGPLSSQRLQNFRDGLEDYNLLMVLERAIAQAEADGADAGLIASAKAHLSADSVATDQRSYTKDPAAYRAWRDDVAAAVVALQPDTTAPAVEPVADVSVTVGSAIAPVAVRATDESLPLSYSLTGVPGLSISAAGVISGTPSEVGSFTGTVTVTDAAGNQSAVSFTVEVKAKVTPPPSSPPPSSPPPSSPPPAAPGFVRTVPYTKPGLHQLNGRSWSTSCEPYSQTERCVTEIWATVVKFEEGRFVRRTGWAFNNLTYLPFMTRAQWADNPLGRTVTFIGTDGVPWRTECDTALTGTNACRSFRYTTVYDAVAKPGGGYVFGQENQWVFNNLVMFGSHPR